MDDRRVPGTLHAGTSPAIRKASGGLTVRCAVPGFNSAFAAFRGSDFSMRSDVPPTGGLMLSGRFRASEQAPDFAQIGLRAEFLEE